MAAYSNTVFLVTILLVLCITEGLDLSSGVPPCSPYMDDCSISDVWATLTCKNEGDPLEKCESNQPAYPQDDASLNYDTMNAAKCKEQCNADSSGTCFYYKFLELGGNKFCYLMSVEQCGDFGDYEDCKNSQHCESGPGNSESCDPNEDGIETPDFTCPGSGDIHTPGLMPDYKLHWVCTDVRGEVNIYTDEAVLGKTRCVAQPSCPDVTIEYTCDKVSGVGKWVKQGDGDFLDTDQNKLLDPTCNARDLAINGYSGQVTKGMDIQCVEGQVGSAGEVAAQNSCLVFCENFPVLHFYTDKNVWKYTSMLEESGNPEKLPNEADPETNIIFCWK